MGSSLSVPPPASEPSPDPSVFRFDLPRGNNSGLRVGRGCLSLALSGVGSRCRGASGAHDLSADVPNHRLQKHFKNIGWKMSHPPPQIGLGLLNHSGLGLRVMIKTKKKEKEKKKEDEYRGTSLIRNTIGPWV